MFVEYELIAGERRLRASKIAGLPQVPVIIRSGNEDAKMKLELAIIENLQREDLNPVDRAWAFMRLHSEFGFTHAEIGKKMGKSREYVSNSLRLLALPQEIMTALSERKISEGHTRPLMMLSDRPEEQTTLFKEIMIKKLSVREAEQLARGIAKEKVRKKDYEFNPEIANYEEKFAESLGTRVHIERRDVGGKIVIDYFSPEDLDTILELLKNNQSKGKNAMLDNFIANQEQENPKPEITNIPEVYHPEITAAPAEPEVGNIEPSYLATNEPEMQQVDMLDDRSDEEVQQDENSDLYNINNFTL
jgi:ParB family chromosome partitioning protein